MQTLKLASRLPIFPLFVVASLIVGWLIPDFYVWTDSDQSRPSPLLWQVPMASAGVGIVFCLALPWLPVSIESTSQTKRSTARFSLRFLLGATGGFAVGTALLLKFPVAVAGIVCAAAYGYCLFFFVRNPPHRKASVGLIACMVLPYNWVLGYDEWDRILPYFAVAISGLPALVPSAVLNSMFHRSMHNAPWLMYLITAFELMIGIWMIRLGPKRTIAYFLLVIHMSALGSLGFYMMCIA